MRTNVTNVNREVWMCDNDSKRGHHFALVDFSPFLHADPDYIPYCTLSPDAHGIVSSHITSE